MVDYTLCHGRTCSHKDTCQRYLWLPRADKLHQFYMVESSCIEQDYIAYWEVDNK